MDKGHSVSPLLSRLRKKLDGERQANIDRNLSKNLNESKAIRQEVFHNGTQLANLIDSMDGLGYDVNSIDGSLKVIRMECRKFGEDLQEIRSEVGNMQQVYSQELREFREFRDGMSQMWSAVPSTLGEMMQTALYRIGIENTYKSESEFNVALEPGSMLTFFHILRAGWSTHNC